MKTVTITIVAETTDPEVTAETTPAEINEANAAQATTAIEQARGLVESLTGAGLAIRSATTVASPKSGVHEAAETVNLLAPVPA